MATSRLAAALVIALARAGTGTAAAGPLTVAVSIPPNAYFVERIGGEHVQVHCLVSPGQSPHTFEPSPKQMAELSNAAVYFRTGVGFEAGLLPRIERMFPKMKIVDLRQRIPLRTMEEGGCEDHEHHAAPGQTPTHAEDGRAHDAHAGHAAEPDEAAHDHHHPAEGKDPHIWLNPRLARIQAQTICDALCALDAAHAEEFRAKLEAFHKDLDALDRRIADALAPLKGRSVFVFHPAFGYFTDAYGLKQVPVEIQGKSPTGRQLAQLIERARAENVRAIFVQPQFATKSAETVAQAIDGVVVPIDPLAQDYIRNLEDMAREVEAGLKPVRAR